MKYNNMIITFWFNEITNLKDYYNTLEQELSGYFSPFNIAGLPANIDPVIPRITAVSHGGHSNFNMSKINVQFATNFDEKYYNNFDSCFSYVNERANLIFNTLFEKCQIKVVYMAIHVNAELSDDNPVKKISEELFSSIIVEKPLLEVGARFSEIIDDNYYSIVNINDAKSVSFTKTFDPNSTNNTIIFPLISQREVKIDKHVIAYGIEINDKYGFDTVEKYGTTFKTVEEMFNLSLESVKKISEKIGNNKLI